VSRAPWAMMLALGAVACSTDGSGLPAVGTLERDRIEVVAEARETLLEIYVREGQQVTAGMPLARQEDARARAALARAEAGVVRASRRVDELLRGPRRESIAEARAGMEGARDRLAVAEREYGRAQDLVEQGLQSEAALDEAQGRRDTSAAELRQWEARLEALLEGTTPEELDQAVAARGEAEALLEDARVTLERLTLRAPRDGVIEAIPFKAGARPPTGAAVLVMMVDQAPYARVYIPQAVRARMRIGMEASVRVAGVDRAFAGELRMISTEAAFTPYYALTERDRGRLTYVAEVALTEPEARDLPSGLPLEVDFPGLEPP
jgi:HlyD family secretion protein